MRARAERYLASRGCNVDAVDFSAQAIEWARERAESAGAAVNFQHCSIFDATFTGGSYDLVYDLVYDSGCFHHLPPHRRKDYAELVHAAGLTVGAISPDNGCLAEAGTVLTQNPNGGTQAQPGSAVTLTESSGRNSKGKPCVID